MKTSMNTGIFLTKRKVEVIYTIQTDIFILACRSITVFIFNLSLALLWQCVFGTRKGNAMKSRKKNIWEQTQKSVHEKLHFKLFYCICGVPCTEAQCWNFIYKPWANKIPMAWLIFMNCLNICEKFFSSLTLLCKLWTGQNAWPVHSLQSTTINSSASSCPSLLMYRAIQTVHAY